MIKVRGQTALRDGRAGQVLAYTEPKPIEFNPLESEDDGQWTRMLIEAWVRNDRILTDADHGAKFPWDGQIVGDGARNKNECGFACARMLAAYLDLKAPALSALSDKYDPPDDGSTPSEVARCLNDMGATARAVAVDSLGELQLPAIILHAYRWRREHVYAKEFFGWHYVVVTDILLDGVLINDPLWPDERGQGVKVTMAEVNDSFIPYGHSGKRLAVQLAGIERASELRLVAAAAPEPLPPEIYTARSERPVLR